MIRFAFLVLVFLALAFAALSDTVYVEAPLSRRINDFLPRVVTVFVWPLAILTPRGRFLSGDNEFSLN